jgi:photosystem II Psb27 protein
MQIKSFLSRLIALVLVVAISLMGCSNSTTGLTGNYREDTLLVLQTIMKAIELPNEDAEKAKLGSIVHEQINDYASRYRRQGDFAGLRSFTTMQTALNAAAGYYTSYGNRPLPDKLKQRLKQEFKQVEVALQRES